MDHSPWVEKYRPTAFDDIVLDKTNKKILNNIIKKNYFPNLLFYGPPGTGKTTTIINLINLYQKTYNQKNKGFMIHLNASDDRGIDIIRNQINQFVNTKTLFGKGMKFVILDEVDYMTKNAQHALRYLIQQYSSNVRFCLICNYISRIDSALQNEFVRLRFCQLPQDKIYEFLNRIQQEENLSLTKETILAVQRVFKSDIRSMINFLQSNHTPESQLIKADIISDSLWETLIDKIKGDYSTDKLDSIYQFIEEKSCNYNIEIKIFIKDFIYYLLCNKEYAIRERWLNLFKYIIHHDNAAENYLLLYTLRRLEELYSEL